MKYLLENVKVQVHPKTYLKDPESSELGQRIIKHSILLIDAIGFESFTFKKLGKEIGSNESSVYRYFENKHKLLLYLSSWYWGWVELTLVIATNNIEAPKDKLRRAIEVISQPVTEDSSFSHINETKLNKIVINEFSKSYLTKEVDNENKDGYFAIYKRLISRLKSFILEVNPKYAYPASLASTVVEGAMHQHFLKEHFVSITDCNDRTTPHQFFCDLVLATLNNAGNEK
ncbi:MAG: TetR/AcrR family transcriptional regulator [Flavobacteriales bacterium]|uniref:TetR/AcrR family transcriptional regulator n=1 Tax=Candidatus Ulvibacter alkanivorans TaxID=2267620 RepID=UPI000DF4C77C|nr:TetR/AcrR family transcriptional regulator [Candidatus Ulvibacter alkanivorans]MCH2490389.1 TetR/AcrR family transcriptional regulator [Flavobacteriales bacterium]